MSQVESMHPVDLLALIHQKLAGDDWEYWDPAALIITLGIQGRTDTDKVAAVQSLLKNPRLSLSDYTAFEKIAHAFCNNPVLPEVDQPLSLEEVLYVVRQIRGIFKKEGGLADFAGEVPSYIAVVATEEGWDALPEELSFSQEMFAHLASVISRKFETEAKSALGTISGMSRENMMSLLDHLENDFSPQAFQLRRYLGLYLFDPTLRCDS